jgi:proteasome lid subunit RPN8/RPN11
MLQLSAALRERIHDEARGSYPAEACGFLVGNGNATGVLVADVIPATNRAADRDRFLIDPRDVFEVMKGARAHGGEVVAVYHSHPDASPVPSMTDRHEAWGDWLHVIVSCEAGESCDARCWRLAERDFVAVPIVEEAA